MKVTPLLLLLLLLSVCGPSSSESAGDRLLVFAAASTSDCMREAVAKFEDRTGPAVTLNLAASSTLAEQIRAGARADLFLSANRRWVELLEEEGLIDYRRELLGNRLVLVQPTDSQSKVNEPADLLSPDVRRVSIADPEGVPAGIYAKQALESMGLWEPLAGKMVRGLDVRQTLLFVERGEVEAGLVYATDAAISSEVVTRYTFEEDRTDPIRYFLTVVRGASPRQDAERLFTFLASPGAGEIFRSYGFEVINGPVER